MVVPIKKNKELYAIKNGILVKISMKSQNDIKIAYKITKYTFTFPAKCGRLYTIADDAEKQKIDCIQYSGA